MLDRLFSKALSLVINGEEISFHTLAEFEFALGGRTNVPASKLADLIVLSPDDLKREAKSIKTVEKRFVDILSRSIDPLRQSAPGAQCGRGCRSARVGAQAPGIAGPLPGLRDAAHQLARLV